MALIASPNSRATEIVSILADVRPAGIGIVLVVDADDADAVSEDLQGRNEPVYRIGEVRAPASGKGRVHWA